MTLRCMWLLLPLGLLSLQLPFGQAVDTFLYQQVLQMALQPRGDVATNTQIQKAIIELVVSQYNMALGVSYPIGTATGLFTPGRKKRFVSFGSSFGNNYGNDWGSNRHDPWGFPSFSSGFFGKSNNNNNHHHNDNNNNHHHNNNDNTNTNTHTHSNPSSSSNFNTYRSNSQVIHCPSQTNQSAVYGLNSSNVGYPSAAIGNEFFVRSLPGSDLFFQCAVRRAILPGQAPVVAVDQNFVTANSTCPSTDLSLFSYNTQNTAIRGRCWVIQGFQEPVQFSVCQQKSCTNCKPKTSSSFSFGHVHPTHGTRNVTVNQCVTDYRTAQVLSYCENLPVNQRIIYERIIIPASCDCQTVDCMTQQNW